MPFVYYVSELEKDVPLDAERLLRLLGVSGKLSGFYFAVYISRYICWSRYRKSLSTFC